AAERGLQRLKYRTDLNTENARLVAVDIEIDRRICRRIGRENARQLRILVGCDHETACDLREILRRTALHILNHELKSAARSKSDDRRWLQTDRASAAQLTKFTSQARDDCIGALPLPFAFVKAP